jgi:competence protein ComEA
MGLAALWLAAGLVAPAIASAVPEIVGGAQKSARVQVTKIDLNAATPAQLAAIKGLTPEWSAKIVAARPFGSLDELAKVGMSKAQIDAVRPFLKIGSAGGPRKGRWRKPAYTLAPGEKVNINTAERKVLEALPYIGVARAIAIMESRPFARIEDLMKVKGIKAKTFARIRRLVVVG